MTGFQRKQEQQSDGNVPKDPEVAALLPSGIVRKFSLSTLLETPRTIGEIQTAGNVQLGTVESDEEARRAEIIAAGLKLNPRTAGIIEREVEFSSAAVLKHSLPPGKRIVVIPIVDERVR